jgi:phage replication initiation protein
MRTNECLIDWLRFSIPPTHDIYVINHILGIPVSIFDLEGRGSPFPTYDCRINVANIEIHTSSTHENVLVNLSGQACRQYEEYMSSVDGWHWHAFIKEVMKHNGKISRIDLALDIFDDSSPNVRKLQDYVKRGQLSSRSQTFKEINSGRVLDGVLTGFTLYIGSNPQILRIYDKKQEIRDNTGEIVNVNQWVRWELEITDKKAMEVANQIITGKPLNIIIRGILSAHYAFKTQPKGTKDFHNKSRWANMKWWDKFIEGMPQIPLRVVKEKSTMKKKRGWIDQSVTKSLAMLYQAYTSAFGENYAKAYIDEILQNGTEKLTNIDIAIIEQTVNELTGTEEY